MLFQYEIVDNLFEQAVRKIVFKLSNFMFLTVSVPFKAVWPKIGPALGKIGSTGFVKMSPKDAFS